MTQRSITRKTNEIGMFAEVMDQVSDLDPVLVIADAMHCGGGRDRPAPRPDSARRHNR